MEFVPQEHWNHGYETMKFGASRDRLGRWLLENAAPSGSGDGLSVFEVGCFPGRYLALFGPLGFELNGCDMTPRTGEMKNWLTERGANVGDISTEDVFRLEPRRLYDVVYSVGFIEHFDDYLAALHAHDVLLKRGGTLVVCCPNFAGRIQGYLHGLFDRENLALHNLRAMDPAEWARSLRDVGYDVLFTGHIGGFEFWTDNRKKPLSLPKKIAAGLVKILGKFAARAPNSASWSPYAALIARKAVIAEDGK